LSTFKDVLLSKSTIAHTVSSQIQIPEEVVSVCLREVVAIEVKSRERDGGWRRVNEQSLEVLVRTHPIA